MTLTNRERKIAGLPQIEETQEILTEEKVMIEFPIFISIHSDYHEIYTMAATLTAVIGKKVKGLELNAENYGYDHPGVYVTSYYIGTKPTKTAIQAKMDEFAKKYKWTKFEEE